ncbi:MAG: 2Fe-2S iron-sulfur cluster-binding protein, partial [Pseudomonadota bacterium]
MSEGPRLGGTEIDTGRSLTFGFDGTPLAGHPGDSVASALLGAGVRIVGRSFKYHRPRGVWGIGVEEPNAIVDIAQGKRRMPNCLATTTRLVEGMEIESVQGDPSARRDRWSLLDRVARFI